MQHIEGAALVQGIARGIATLAVGLGDVRSILHDLHLRTLRVADVVDDILVAGGLEEDGQTRVAVRPDIGEGLVALVVAITVGIAAVGIDRGAVQHQEVLHIGAGQTDHVVAAAGGLRNGMGGIAGVILAPHQHLGDFGKIFGCEHIEVRVGRIRFALLHLAGVGGQFAHIGIAHLLGCIHGLLEEPLGLVLDAAGGISIGSAGPLRPAGNEGGAGEILQPGALEQGHAGLQHQGCVLVDAGGLEIDAAHQLDGLVEVLDDEAGHLVLRRAAAGLGQHFHIIGKWFLDDRIIAEGHQFRVVIISAQEIGLADAMLDAGVRACDLALGVFREHLLQEIVDIVEVLEAPVTVRGRDLPQVVHIAVLDGPGNLVVRTAVAAEQAVAVGAIAGKNIGVFTQQGGLELALIREVPLRGNLGHGLLVEEVVARGQAAHDQYTHQDLAENIHLVHNLLH